MFRHWLMAMWHETGPALLSAFSLASTILTFVPQLGVGAGIRAIPVTCLVVGFVWANVRVFSKQRRRIHDLESSPKSEPRRAKLVIYPGEKMHALPIRKADASQEAVATYLEFHLAVENKGDRNSTINRYDLDIPQMARYENVKPFESRHSLIQVVGYNYSPAQPYLMSNGFIAVIAESMTALAYLPFRVPDPPPKTGPVYCILILTDTEGNSASHKFVLRE